MPLETLRLADPALRERLMGLYRLALFTGSAERSQTAQERGFVTAILSNGSPDMLRDAVAASHLVAFSTMSYRSRRRVFKPHPKIYDLAGARLGLPAASIAFQLFQFLGRLRRLCVWHACRVVQPLWTASRAATRRIDCEIRSLVELPALLERRLKTEDRRGSHGRR